MFVTSFSSISYCSNSEYWTQKCIQSESIHSIILDVHVLKAERQNSLFLSVQLFLTLRRHFIWENKSSIGPIPDRGTTLIHQKQMRDILRQASGPVQFQFGYIHRDQNLTSGYLSKRNSRALFILQV